MLYKKWLNEWLAVCVKPTVKQRTYEKYERICQKHLLSLGNYRLDELTAPVLQTFVANKTSCLSPNTVNVIISVLKNSLKKAVTLGVTEREYADGVSRPRASEKKIECFFKEEQKKLETAVLKGPKRLVGVLLCLYTGLRIGELLALTWDDIDFADGVLSVTKSCHDGWGKEGYRRIIESPKTGSSVRLIPVPKQLQGMLKRVKKEIGGTYVVGGDKLISVRAYQRSFELLLKKLNIPRRGFHVLRHTFATRAIECGVDVKTLAEFLGHKNPTVTLNRYVHSLMEHKHMMMNRLGKLLQ